MRDGINARKHKSIVFSLLRAAAGRSVLVKRKIAQIIGLLAVAAAIVVLALYTPIPGDILRFVVRYHRIFVSIVFWYPCVMGLMWVIGALFYYVLSERNAKAFPCTTFPLVSVIVPAYNEGANIVRAIDKLNKLDYPNYEIIIINDGSSDNSPAIERELMNRYARVRFVDLQENCGKANALYLGYVAARGEYLMCVDGDSYLDRDCIRRMVAHFLPENGGERTGAVTGNPRVRNRSSLLAQLQLCECIPRLSA